MASNGSMIDDQNRLSSILYYPIVSSTHVSFSENSELSSAEDYTIFSNLDINNA